MGVRMTGDEGGIRPSLNLIEGRRELAILAMDGLRSGC